MHKVRAKISQSIVGLASLSLLGCSISAYTPEQRNVPLSDLQPHVINLNTTFFEDSSGGLITAELDGDGQRDFVISQTDSIHAYSYSGQQLWTLNLPIQLSDKAERKGLPGLHGSGLQAGDIDQDGRVEVLFVTQENTLAVVDGATGEIQHQIGLPAVDAKFGRWEHVIIGNFQGQGEVDLLLQASRDVDDEPDYIRDSVQAAFRFVDLVADTTQAKPLWMATDFLSLSHGTAKVIDLNQDGRDEVVAGSILSPDGEKLYEVNLPNHAFNHVDSIAVGDIQPDRPGLEVVIPEEGGTRRIILFDDQGEIWTSLHRLRSVDKDGDKAVVGEFDPATPGLEMWFRGGDSDHFTMLNAQNQVISSYQFDETKPDNWTDNGIEVIHRIRWTGDTSDLIVAKERHEAGNVGIFDPLTGLIVELFEAEAERLYVADVTGDWREEVIVVEDDQIRVYVNDADNPNPDQPRLWQQPHYRRLKMTWNYYST